MLLWRKFQPGRPPTGNTSPGWPRKTAGNAPGLETGRGPGTIEIKTKDGGNLHVHLWRNHFQPFLFPGSSGAHRPVKADGRHGAMGTSGDRPVPEDTFLGQTMTYEEAKKCAACSGPISTKSRASSCACPISGETGVADAIKMSGLNVPILIQACDDDLDKLQLEKPPGMLTAASFPCAAISIRVRHPL